MFSADVDSSEECGEVGFTKDDVLALLSEGANPLKLEEMKDTLKRWFQQVEETHVKEKENLKATISKLEENVVSLHGKLAREFDCKLAIGKCIVLYL